MKTRQTQSMSRKDEGFPKVEVPLPPCSNLSLRSNLHRKGGDIVATKKVRDRSLREEKSGAPKVEVPPSRRPKPANPPKKSPKQRNK